MLDITGGNGGIRNTHRPADSGRCGHEHTGCLHHSDSSRAAKAVSPDVPPQPDPSDLTAKLAASGVTERQFEIVVLDKAAAAALLPDDYYLDQNYPNPFNPTTMIRYGLPEEARVTLTIYNILGQKIRTLVQDLQPAGRYQILWNGTNDTGGPLPAEFIFTA